MTLSGSKAWGACGGRNWDGATCCEEGYRCIEATQHSNWASSAVAGCEFLGRFARDSWKKIRLFQCLDLRICPPKTARCQESVWYSQCRPVEEASASLSEMPDLKPRPLENYELGDCDASEIQKVNGLNRQGTSVTMDYGRFLLLLLLPSSLQSLIIFNPSLSARTCTMCELV